MEKSKLLVIALVVMVVLNLGLISFMLFQSRERHHKRLHSQIENCKKEGHGNFETTGAKKQWGEHKKEGKKGSHKGRLPEKIGFTEEQKKEFDLLMKEHISQMDVVREKENLTRAGLMKLLKEEPINESIKDSLLEMMAANKAEMSTLFFDHFAGIRAMCTKDQKVKFDSLMSKMDDRMMHHPPR